MIERHFTLDKQQKGTDHKLSLEPNELQQLVQRIRSIEARFLGDLNDDDESVLKHLVPILK